PDIMRRMATTDSMAGPVLRSGMEEALGYPYPDDAAGRILRLVGMFRLTVATTLLTVSLVWPEPLVPGPHRDSALFLPVAFVYLGLAAIWLSWQWRPD